MKTCYFLRLDIDGAPEMEATREQWVRAERNAGFRPRYGEDPEKPCTGGFSGHGVRGRIMLEWEEDKGEGQ